MMPKTLPTTFFFAIGYDDDLFLTQLDSRCTTTTNNHKKSHLLLKAIPLLRLDQEEEKEEASQLTNSPSSLCGVSTKTAGGVQ